MVNAFDAEVSLAAGTDPVFDEHLSRTRALADEVAGLAIDGSASAQLQARRLLEMLALTLQGSLMLRSAPSAVAEAFIHSRLAADRGHMYGTLLDGTDYAAILDRH